MKKMLMFPGQGSQRQGMLKNVDPVLLEKVVEITGYQLRDDEETYQSTIGIQLAIFIKQLDVLATLQKETTFDLVGGHSIGAYAAAVASGSLGVRDGISLVYQRASLMEKAYPRDYGMGVIVGLREEELAPLIAAVHTADDPVYLANKNAPLQMTVSGKLRAINRLFVLTQEAGASKTQLLKVPVPSHCPLMTKVAQELSIRIAKLDLKTPNCLYLANHTGMAVGTPQEIGEDLAQNVQYPVLWDVMLEIALERQLDVFIELPPGGVLSSLVKVKEPSLKLITMEQIGTEGTLFLLNKWEGR